MMGSIYTFWYSLSSSSSILEKGFWFIYHLQMTSSEEFQQHFSIISKFVCCGFYIQKNTAFTLISFAVLKSDECLSVQLPFELHTVNVLSAESTDECLRIKSQDN